MAEQLSSPDLTISVIEDGVIPVAADVAEVAGIVSSGTAIVRKLVTNYYVEILITFKF